MSGCNWNKERGKTPPCMNIGKEEGRANKKEKEREKTSAREAYFDPAFFLPFVSTYHSRV